MGSSTTVLGRRQFLVRSGVLAAFLAAGDLALLRRFARGDDPSAFDAMRPVLQDLARDTISGLIAFAVPGGDAYSRAQGLTDDQPGGLDGAGTEFMLEALDFFYPIPDEYVSLLVQAFTTGARDSGFPVPGELAGPLATLSAEADDALAQAFQNDDAMPLSMVFAMMLNNVATQVNPASVTGPFAGPFANLSWDEKAEVFRILEEDTVTVARSVDGGLPQPMKDSLSGLIAFAAGALIEFATFGPYTEFGVFDATNRQLTGVPVGWRLTGYLASVGFEPVDGWDELRGYYRGVTEVSDQWPAM